MTVKMKPHLRLIYKRPKVVLNESKLDFLGILHFIKTLKVFEFEVVQGRKYA